MKRVLKCSLIGLVVVSLLLGMVPTVFATSEETNGTLDTGDMTMQGTNAFGQMLAAEFEEIQAETTEEYEAGYSVTALEITGGVATVTYDSLEAANLVVAIYTEDGKQLLTSEKVQVSEEETEATVTFTDTLPTYFRAEAFLLDTYDYSPLCESFDTPLYTQEMQELLASTTADYDENLVLNLDEDDDTNFAIFNENVKQIIPMDGINIVASMDDEAMVYVIENADEQITSLQAGDIVAYEYSEDDLLIVKVSSLSMDDTTATVVGAEMEMEEVFSHVKVEGDGDTEDVVVDTTNTAEELTYNGLVQGGVQTFALEGGATVTAEHEFKINFEKEKKSKYLDAKVELKGSLKFELPVSVKYYIAWNCYYAEFKAEPNMTLSASVSGEVTGKIPLGYFAVSPCPGVYVGFEPTFEVGFEGKVELALKVAFTVGMKFEVGKGSKNLSTTPKPEMDFDIEAQISIGINWTPSIRIISEKVVSIEATIYTGFVLDVKASGRIHGEEDKNAKVKHACYECLDMTLSFKAEISGKIKFLNAKRLTFEIEIGKWTLKIGDLYFSFDNVDLGWGKCPYKEYRVTMQAKNAAGGNVSGAKITIGGDKSDTQTTGDKGTVVTYLPKGKYTFKTMISGEECKKTLTIDEAVKVVLKPKASSTGSDVIDNVQKDEVLDESEGVYIGVPHVNLLKTGTRKVGSGVSVRSNGSGGWNVTKTVNNDSEVAVDFGNGVSINDYPFMYLTVDATVPFEIAWYDGNNQRWIAAAADYYPCFDDGDESAIAAGSHEDIVLDLREVYEWWDGAVPANATVHDMYIIPKGVGTVEIKFMHMLQAITLKCGDNAYCNLDNRGHLRVFGKGTVYDSALQNWPTWRDDILSVAIEDGITEVGYKMFDSCYSMESVRIPKSVKTIEYGAFNNCWDLTNVYYAGTQAQWNAITIDYGNGELVSAVKHYNSSATYSLQSGTVENNTEYQAVVGGSYETFIPSDGSAPYKIASFKGLVAGKQYTMLALAETQTDDKLDRSNLLYIEQAVAGDDGTLAFTYIPRENAAVSYVMVCGASDKDLNDAEITFKTMVSGADITAIEPIVVYNGETLVEGEDYVVVGKTDYTESGEFTCTVRGIYDYTGTVLCTYTVKLLGDLTNDHVVNTKDVREILKYNIGTAEFNEEQILISDANDDGKVNTIDTRLFLVQVLDV